jgi:septation ring formation regulator EzrA
MKTTKNKMEIEQPNPYKELRKELAIVYHHLGKTLSNIDKILKRLEEQTQ